MKQVEITSKIIGRGGSTTSASPSLDLSGYALISDLLNYVTISGNEDVTGLHDFVNGLKIGGLPITKKQDDVVYLDANLVVRGGITMYAENEVDIPSILDSLPIASNTALGIASFDSTYFSVDSNGMVSLTSAPSSDAPSLGELLNVDESNDAVASVDRVLFQSAGSNVWSWKPLSEIGGGSSGGGGSVSGNYLPLSGGTLTNSIAPQLILKGYKSDSYIVYSSTWDSQTSVHSGLVNFSDLGLCGSFGVYDRIIFPFSRGVYYREGYSGANYKLLHEGNYSNYALPLSGGTVIGNIRLQAPGGNNPYTSLELAGSNTDLWQISGRFNKNSGIENNKLDIYYYNGSTWASIMTLQTNGNVGIGTTSPSQKLHVSGTIASSAIIVNGSPATQIHLYPNGANAANYCEISGHMSTSSSATVNMGLRFNTSATSDRHGANAMTLFNSRGHAYYDASSHTFNSNILTSGGITMYSDIRKKTKLQDVELSLSQIANAPLIEHYYNSDQNKTTHVGSIAQYWASLNNWFCKLDAEGFYTMEIQNCALASAISIARELVKYESKTDRTIRKMKQRIQELEDEVERLKQN